QGRERLADRLRAARLGNGANLPLRPFVVPPSFDRLRTNGDGILSEYHWERMTEHNPTDGRLANRQKSHPPFVLSLSKHTCAAPRHSTRSGRTETAACASTSGRE